MIQKTEMNLNDFKHENYYIAYIAYIDTLGYKELLEQEDGERITALTIREVTTKPKRRLSGTQKIFLLARIR